MAQREYVMIDSQSILVEVYHREKSRWSFSRYGLHDEVEIESLGIQFLVCDAYKKTTLIRRASKDL
jgi:hypothetical protein